MKLSTGKVGFPIEFDNGDKEVIYFNPNDSGIRERIAKFEKSVESKMKAIDLEKYKRKFESGFEINMDDPERLFELSADELKQYDEKLGVIEEIEKQYNNAVKEEIDVVFNSQISHVVFKYCNPFDLVVIENEDGTETRELFIMQFLRWMVVEIKKHGEKNQAAMKKHLSKYAK